MLLSLLTNWKKIVLVALVCAAYLKGCDDGADSKQKEWNAEKLKTSQLIAKKVADDLKDQELLARALEEELSSNQADFLALNRRLQHEVSSNLIYSTCVLPDSGLQLDTDAWFGAGRPTPR